jgi:hypothetical protein
MEEDRDARKGSVRAARQRLQAAQIRTQLPDTSRIIGLPQRPNQLVSQYPAQIRAEQQQLLPTARGGAADTISPPPQWPLPNETAAASSSPVLPPRSPKRLQLPQQSYRPTSEEMSPPYAQSSELLQPLSPDYTQVSYRSDGMFSPNSHQSSRPLTNTSFISETSSLGSIPDFPVAQPPMPSTNQARRMPSLGPPPSSRRGPSSYYTQMSYVSPIVEESRHGSYASSNVFPSHRDFFPNDDLMSDDDSIITSDRGTISPFEQDDGRGLVQQPALVRQASLGRRTKPSLMTIKSVDSLGERKGTSKNKSEGTRAVTGAMGIGGAMSSSKAATQGNSGLGKEFRDASSSSESLASLKRMQDLTAGTFESADQQQQETHPATLAERAGMRRPLKIDMDAVRDAEARGSLTSLPELIRRATRLAANLDRGKTASRLGLDFWETGAPDRREMRQSGLSDMLAAFPPPGHVTPVRSGTPNAANNRAAKWPSTGSRLGATDSTMSDEKRRERRRCCGMPMWTFVTLMIVLLFIIAAAVVIPVVLVVIPNQNKSNNSAAQDGQGGSSNGNNNNNNGNSNVMPGEPAPTLPPGTGQCDSVLTCQNGGISVLNADRACNCVCINGFTGRTCANNDSIGCTTINLAGAANNATVGTAVSRLLGSGAETFNIPLNSTRVLTLFSELSLSCPAQNALITFNGLASRSETRHLHSMNLRHALEPSRSLPILHNPHPHPAQALGLAKRQAIGDPGPPAATKSAQSSATPTLPVSSNTQALDFARVGVLFALQESGDLDTAAKAQESIQSFLANNRNGKAASNSINLGPFKIDLVQLTISLSNGTTIRASTNVPASAP